MKKIILAVMMVFLVQSAAYADEGERFEKIRAKVLEKVNQKRSFLNDFESCVKSANTREDMKTCRQNHKKKMEALRAERKEMKGKRKDRREKRKAQD